MNKILIETPLLKQNVKEKILLKNYMAPGDVCMTASAIRDLAESKYGQNYLINVSTSFNEVFENNPYISSEPSEDDPYTRVIEMSYPLIHQSNTGSYSFIQACTHYLGQELGIDIPFKEYGNFVYISDLEKSWYSAIYEKLGKDVPYWIIDAGYKRDFTCKQWDFSRYQEIVDRFPEVTFVQIGLDHPDHFHPQLKGENLINMVGKTDNRQLIRLIYNSFGVITPVSLPMVLSYGIPPHPRFKRKSRACIVIAGGREPNVWQAGPNHQFLHTCGMLDCCDLGGCWKSRVVPLKDRKSDKKDEKNLSLCLKPRHVKKTNQIIPKCMQMISTDDVCKRIKLYMENLKYKA